MNAVTEFFRDWGRLVNWLFFRPWNLRDTSEDLKWVNEKSLPDQVTTNPYSAKSWHFLLQSFSIATVLALTFDGLIGLLISSFGADFKWDNSFTFTAIGIVSGFVGGLLGKGLSNDLNLCVRGSIVGGTLLGIAAGHQAGLVIGFVIGISSGILIGIEASVLSYLRFGFDSDDDKMHLLPRVLFLLGFGIVLGGSVFFVILFSTGLARRAVLDKASIIQAAIMIACLAWMQKKMGSYSLVCFFPFELFEAVTAVNLAKRNDLLPSELFRTQAFIYRTLVLPELFLSKLLLSVSRKNLEIGLSGIVHLQLKVIYSLVLSKTLFTLVSQDEAQFFTTLDKILSIKRVNNQDNPAIKLFALYAGHVKKFSKSLGKDFLWLADYWSQVPSIPFRILLGYGNLFQVLRSENDRPIKLSENTTEYLPQLLELLKESRVLPHGEEFYQSLNLIYEGRSCEGLPQISSLHGKFTQLFNRPEFERPLRPQIVTVLRRLRDAAQDASAFLTGEHELTRKDAVLKAGDVLEEARQLANEVYEPERSLLLAVIEHWRRMFAIEGGRVAEQREVEVLPNPYVAGRPIRPEDGRLFVGRKDEFRSIEEKLQSGVGIVMWGQRRIGKTSMLLHLPGHLSHDLLPVYLNLQMLMANSTGGFLYAVAREIVKQLNGRLRGTEPLGTEPRAVATGSTPSDAEPRAVATGSTPSDAEPRAVATGSALKESTRSLPLPVPYLPSADEFAREPYLNFNHLLEDIERQLQPGQRVVLSFDEFESLEERVKSGKIEPEIFAYLRGVTQTGRGFALLFAGLHTLEQMTREYWNPFFASVQTLKISYLSELDAEQLITDPIEQFPLSYEYEAIKRITDLTRSHAYLTQSLCHNLVNRLNDPLHRSQKAKREDVDAVVEKTLESSGYYFDDFVWGWSNENERMALSLLAETEGEASFSIVEKHLGREAALEATRKLVGRDILFERTGETGELVFRFQIPLAQMWVKQKKPSARILMEGGKI